MKVRCPSCEYRKNKDQGTRTVRVCGELLVAEQVESCAMVVEPFHHLEGVVDRIPVVSEGEIVAYKEIALMRPAEHYDGPVVALTAHAMSEERERSEKSGFTTFLSKPIDRAALFEVLQRFYRSASQQGGG